MVSEIPSGTVPARTTRENLLEFLILSKRELSLAEEEGHHVSIYSLFQPEISPMAEHRESVIKTTNIAPLLQCHQLIRLFPSDG